MSASSCSCDLAFLQSQQLHMGRPRGKGKKPAEFLSNDDDGGGGEEPAPTTDERSGRLREHQAGEVQEDIAKVEVDTDGDPKSTVESKGGTKRPRRRRVKRSSGLAKGEGKDGDLVIAKVERSRRTGSRRKSTPRRAAEAGVGCVE